MTVLVTGAGGYLGRLLVAELARRGQAVLALDLREPPVDAREPGVEYLEGDVRAPGLAQTMRARGVDAVAHLASIVTPGRGSSREHEYSVDVLGTKNVLEACVEAGVTKIVVTSSGAAYGYHADNPPLIDESQPLRGNREFAYAWHKRLVEEMLAEYRAAQPQLAQVVLRVGTILGETTRNQITDLFDKPRLIALRGVGEPVRVRLGPGRGRLPRARARARPRGRVQRRGRRRARGARDRRAPGQALRRAARLGDRGRARAAQAARAVAATVRSRFDSCATGRCSTTAA